MDEAQNRMPGRRTIIKNWNRAEQQITLLTNDSTMRP